jgi:hypothetical protein
MTITTHTLEFRHASEGEAVGTVSLEHVPHVGQMHVAALAYAGASNRAPIYRGTFAPNAKGGKGARRAERPATGAVSDFE